jgi:hypothetical protein
MLRSDQPPLAVTWYQLLEAASSPDDVITAARDFITKFDHTVLARLPAQCQPHKMIDTHDIAAYAYDLARYHCAGDDAETAAVLNDLSAFFSQAVVRLSKLAIPRAAA